jgi:hypothetical protein
MATRLFSAQYIASNKFSISGDFRRFFGEKQAIYAYMGVGGDVQTFVGSFLYNDSNNRTEVTIDEAVLVSTLFRVSLGGTYCAGASTNLAMHDHTVRVQGGVIPAASLTNDQIATIGKIPYLAPEIANFVLAASIDGGIWKAKACDGTADQITVVHTDTTITLSLPQDIATTSTPLFAGAKFSTLSGVLIGHAANPLTAVMGYEEACLVIKDEVPVFSTEIREDLEAISLEIPAIHGMVRAVGRRLSEYYDELLTLEYLEA